MPSPDLTTMMNEVNGRLTYLNSVYLNSIKEPVFGGNNITMDILKLDGTSPNATFNFVDINDAKISIFSDEIYTTTSIQNITSYEQINMSEINCLPLLSSFSDSNTTNFITGLYTLYGVLNADYFDLFVSNTKNNISYLPLKIPMYFLNEKMILKDESKKIDINLNYISPTLLTNIVYTQNFNAFVARRIVYLWILMYHFSISYNFYKANPNNPHAIALALACAQLLVNNNSQFEYQSAMTNAVQSSRSAQVSKLTYDMWCIVVQTLIPPSLGTFDTTNGIIKLTNNSDTCTHIDPSFPINNLKNNYDSLIENYENIEPNSSSDFINNITNKLTNITNKTSCKNSLSNNKLQSSTAQESAKTQYDNAKDAESLSLNELKNASNELQRSNYNLSQARNSRSIPLGYQQLISNEEFNLENIEKKTKMDPAPIIDYSANGTRITYTIMFDINIVTYPSYFINILCNGDEGHGQDGRHPSIYFTQNGQLLFSHGTEKDTLFHLYSNTRLTSNTYYTITIVVANNTISLYINGNNDTLATHSGTKSTNSAGNTIITVPTNDGLVWGSGSKLPNWTWLNYKDGSPSVKIKNVYWWNTALTNTQILNYSTNKNNQDTSSEQTAYNTAYNDYIIKNNAYNNAKNDTKQKLIVYIGSQQVKKYADSILNSVSSASTPSNTSIQIKDLQNLTNIFLKDTEAYKSQPTITADNFKYGELYDIKRSISKNISTYRKKQTQINDIAPVLDENKIELKSTQLQLTSRKKYGNKLKIYKYIALFIMILITIFACVIISMPLDKSMKMLLTTLLTVIVIVNAFILQVFFNSSGIKEKFASGSLQQGNDDITVADLNFMDAASAYLVQTENLNIMLQSNNVYNNTNESLSKQLSYYNDASEQLVNSTDKIGSIYKSSYIMQVQYNSTIQLIKTLSIIIAGFTIAYVALESLEITGSVYMWISCIAGFFIVIALVIYMLEISVRVRTSPKQIYWGQPSSSLLK